MATKAEKAAPRRQPRKQGRPKRSDAAVGKDAIVEATRVLLKTVPPAKLTRRSVAQAAGVDPGLVRYYFGDTTALLTHVVEAIAASLRGKLEISAASVDLSPKQRLKQRVQIMLDTFVENPHFHELFVELMLYRDSERARSLRRSITRRSLTELEALLGEAGPKTADPRFVYVALFGILEFFVTGRPLLEELFPAHTIGSKKLQSDYADFVGDLLFGAVGR